MLTIKNTVLPSPDQWGIIVKGMRNPMNSWDKSDSSVSEHIDWNGYVTDQFSLGDNDLALMTQLAKAGAAHAKYRRMIPVFLTVVAPLYWWKEFDTYKVGTVANSCSTMHKIHAKEFTLDDFSTEHLVGKSFAALQHVIDVLNLERKNFVATKDKDCWWQIIQLLPSSYNQRRTLLLNYEVLANIYTSRKNHKLDEWRTFCDWIRELPYSDLITGGVDA